MPYIKAEKINLEFKIKEEYMASCPFSAIKEDTQGYLYINENCRMCLACLKFGANVFSYHEEVKENSIEPNFGGNINEDKGIMVFLEGSHGRINPVSLQLLHKAQELRETYQQNVYAVFLGFQTEDLAQELRSCPADQIFVYDHPDLKVFQGELYREVICRLVEVIRPAVLLFGATPLGRHLAPGVATKLRTGLTADCTDLYLDEENNLLQTRPAFGGNIMARIKTPKSRPQIATVRPNVFPVKNMETSKSKKYLTLKPTGLQPKITKFLDLPILDSRVYAKLGQILTQTPKPIGQDITQGERIIALGRGFKRLQDLKIAEELAGLLKAQIAYSRPLVEAGWGDPLKQVGLSGRSIAPKLLITLGISGSVQFLAGIQGAQYVLAVNTDAKAPIMKRADLSLVGDLYQIVPLLVAKLIDS